MYGSSRRSRRRGDVTSLLFERERGPTPHLDMTLLRWAASAWLDKPIHSQSYCKLNPEAKSTIALAFSTDGVLFASTHGDHTVKVFQCATWSILCTLRGHRRTPWTIKFHPRDRNILASGSLDETVRIWDLRTKTCVRTLEFDFVVSCLAFHSSGELLAVTSGRRIFLCRWGQRGSQPQAVASTTPMGTSVIPTPPQQLSPAPPAVPPSLPGILERLAGWGGGSNSGGGSGGAPAAAATNSGSGGAGNPPAGGGSGGGGALAWTGHSEPEAPNKVVILSGENPQRCVAFKRSATHELFFVAETNPETPPEPPPQPNLYQPHQAPPFTVQLFMWTFPIDQSLEDHMRTRLDTSLAVLRVARSVMYSDAGFDVSKCGRYLALCELDPQVGYHLRTFSLQRRSMGEALQTVALPNCPFVTSVQFAPLSFAILIGYGRCQAPSVDQAPQYAVLRCISFAPRAGGSARQLTEDVELFSVDSTDESNVALFHPHPHACAQLGFLYATKDGRIRAFRFERERERERESVERPQLRLS